MPRVSAIITTHNRSRLLPRAVESVLAQTFKDFELIVVDDASTDATPEVLTRYEGLCRTIRVETSKGANHARNVGLSHARGELVAYLDDDDRWLPRKLELQASVFERSPGAALVGSWFRMDGEVREVPEDVGYAALLKDNVLGGFSMCMFPRGLAGEVGGMDETLRNAQDWDLWLKLARRGRTFCVPECLVEYSTCEPERISLRRDGTAHYESYRRVVERHVREMRAWTRLKHRLILAYHTTARSRRLRKLCLGGLYLTFRWIDR